MSRLPMPLMDIPQVMPMARMTFNRNNLCFLRRCKKNKTIERKKIITPKSSNINPIKKPPGSPPKLKILFMVSFEVSTENYGGFVFR